MTARPWLALLVLLVGLVACGGDDDGVGDGGRDGGAFDGGVRDGGVDAGTTDGGMRDTGAGDAALDDGGRVDDGGASDAGAGDGGASDGGRPDAGPPDAGRDGGGPTCLVDGDCGVASCGSDSDGRCVEDVPVCVGGTCSVMTATVPGTCDPGTGRCTPIAECAVDCDCAQGLLCASGTCLVGIIARWCCTNPGCPTGASCVNPDESMATCP